MTEYLKVWNSPTKIAKMKRLYNKAIIKLSYDKNHSGFILKGIFLDMKSLFHA